MTESDVCREALKAEVDNLRQYAAGFFQKIDRVRSFGPWLVLAAPMVIPLFRLLINRNKPTGSPRAPTWKGKLASLMLGVRLFRQYSPVVRSIASHFISRRGASTEAKSGGKNA